MLNLNTTNIISKIRLANPLAHHITNYVTVNDCANATIAIGGSAAMVDFIDELEDFSAIGSALVLNTGTLNEELVRSMLRAASAYSMRKKPIVLDPVGFGISKARDAQNLSIINQGGLSIIKGNASEIASVIGLEGKARGVDSTIEANEAFLEEAKKYSKEHNVVLAITGKVDYVVGIARNADFSEPTLSPNTQHTSEENANVYVAKIFNGSPMAAKITGAGCMCASMCGVFSAVYVPFFAAIYALSAFGIASEEAEKTSSGTGSFRANLLDELSKLDDGAFAKHIKYELQ